MARRTKLKRFFAGIGIMLFVLISGYLVILPYYLSWGATHEEGSRSMPGDLDHIGWTRAITIDAAPEQVWPWLMQWGQGRGGWYSYDWLENLFGFDIHTADRILPEYQNLAIGDPICMARGFCTSHVTVLEPNRWLSWQAKDESDNPVWTFTFGLFSLDADHTRLVVRESFRSDFMPPAAVFALGIPDGVMELKSLNTIKSRAEGIKEAPFITPLEIIAWLTALVIGLIALMLFTNRSDWKNPAVLMVASAVVLLPITFLYLPLWLRTALDLGLLAGLVWIMRQPLQVAEPQTSLQSKIQI